MKHAESQFLESYAHAVEKVLPGEWMVLGTGYGARVTWHEEGVGFFTAKNARVDVFSSSEPIVETTWSK